MEKLVQLVALLACAFAVSYLVFAYGPGYFKDAGSADPPGMVWFPAAPSCGAATTEHARRSANAQVAVGGFWMDQTAVTNEQFERFVKSTGYVTVAERTPSAKDFPGAMTPEMRPAIHTRRNTSP